MILQKDPCIFSMEVIWVVNENRNQPGKAWVKMGQINGEGRRGWTVGVGVRKVLSQRVFLRAGGFLPIQ